MDDKSESLGYSPRESKVPKKALAAAAGIAAFGGIVATNNTEKAADIAQDVGGMAMNVSVDQAKNLLHKAEARFETPYFGEVRADGRAVSGESSWDLIYNASIVPAGLNGEMPPVIRKEPKIKEDNIVSIDEIKKMGVDISRLEAKKVWGATYPSSGSGQVDVGDHQYGKWAKFEVKNPDGSKQTFFVAETFITYDKNTPPSIEIIVESR